MSRAQLVIRARVLTFHDDDSHVAAVTRALDAAAANLGAMPGFRGLLCLGRDLGRNEILVITLWVGQGLEGSEADHDIAQREIATAVDTGVGTKCYDVLRSTRRRRGTPRYRHAASGLRITSGRRASPANRGKRARRRSG